MFKPYQFTAFAAPPFKYQKPVPAGSSVTVSRTTFTPVLPNLSVTGTAFSNPHAPSFTVQIFGAPAVGTMSVSAASAPNVIAMSTAVVVGTARRFHVGFSAVPASIVVATVPDATCP